MKEVDLREEDIEEKFIRASGRGGQKINKTSSSVYLKHTPTGIEVKCMKERSQSLNRFFARRELAERVGELAGIKSESRKKEEKMRKQKAKKKKRAVKKYGEDKSGNEGGGVLDD